MTREYRCDQCGDTVNQSLMEDLKEEAPDECPNCGNNEFSETVVGKLHPTIDEIT